MLKVDRVCVASVVCQMFCPVFLCLIHETVQSTVKTYGQVLIFEFIFKSVHCSETCMLY